MKRTAIIIALVFFAVCFAGCSSPTNTVERYIKRSAEGDLEGAKSLCTGELLEMIELSERMITRMGMNPADMSLKAMGIDWSDVKSEIDVKPGKISGDNAEVHVNAAGIRVKYMLVNIDGQWKIKNIYVQGLGDINEMMNIIKSLSGMR